MSSSGRPSADELELGSLGDIVPPTASRGQRGGSQNPAAARDAGAPGTVAMLEGELRLVNWQDHAIAAERLRLYTDKALRMSPPEMDEAARNLQAALDNVVFCHDAVSAPRGTELLQMDTERQQGVRVHATELEAEAIQQLVRLTVAGSPSLVSRVPQIVSELQQQVKDHGANVSVMPIVCSLLYVRYLIEAGCLANVLSGYRRALFTLALTIVRDRDHDFRLQAINNLLVVLHEEPGDPVATAANAEQIWAQVQGMTASQDPVEVADGYALFCVLSDIVTSERIDPAPHYPRLYLSTPAWRLMQAGLGSDDPLVCKRARHVTEASVAAGRRLRTKPQWTEYFTWSEPQSATLESAWGTFFSLYDSLDSFAAHLVKPLWAQITATEALHPTWAMIIYRKAFLHENGVIIKFTLQELLQRNLTRWQKEAPEATIEFVIHTMLRVACGHHFLFYTPVLSSTNQSVTCSLLLVFADRYITGMPRAERVLFARRLFTFLCMARDECRDATFEQCMYILAGIGEHVPAWGTAELSAAPLLLNRINQQVYGTRDPMLAGMLHGIAMLTDPAAVTATDVSSLLAAAPNYVIRGTPRTFAATFALLTAMGKGDGRAFLSSVVTAEVAQQLSQQNTESLAAAQRRALGIARLCAHFKADDAADNEALKKLLAPVTEALRGIYAHANALPLTQERALRLCTALLSEGGDAVRPVLTAAAGLWVDEVTAYAEKTLLALSNPERPATPDDDEISAVCCEALSTLLSEMPTEPRVRAFCDRFIPVLTDRVSQVTRLRGAALTVETERGKMQLARAAAAVASGSQANTDAQRAFIEALTACEMNKRATAVTPESWSAFTEARWQAVHDALNASLRARVIPSVELATTVLHAANDAIDSATAYFLPVLMRVLRVTMAVAVPPMLAANEDQARMLVRSVVRGVWLVIKESNRSRIVTSIGHYSRMVFQSTLVRLLPLSDILHEAFENVAAVAATTVGAMNHVATVLCPSLSANLGALREAWCEQLIQILLFGPIRRIVDATHSASPANQAELAQFEAILLDSKLETVSYPPVFDQSDAHSRANALRLLLRLDADNDMEARALVNILVMRLFEITTPTVKDNIHSINSSVHHKRHRAWTAITILTKFCKLWAPVEAVETAFFKAFCVVNMPSVRLQMIVVYVHLLLAVPSLIPKFLAAAGDVGLRAQYLCSLLTVAVHVGPHLPPQDRQAYYSALSESAGHWATAHHFNVRVSGQLMIVCILEQCEQYGLRLADHGMFARIAHFLRESKDLLKHGVKLAWPFKDFKPVSEYGLELLGVTIPRAGGVFEPEWVLPSTIQMLDRDVHEYARLAPIIEPPKAVAPDLSAPKAAMVADDDGGVAPDNTDEDFQASAWDDFQRKVQPAFDNDADEVATGTARNRSRQRKGLIVVGSLIDKPPNLGGLARTCEIFNAEALVVNDLHVREMKEFQSVSVTAEKWVNMIEVKEPDLPAYLESCRRRGYALLGVEQTAQAVSLADMQFPEKTVLVLGKEKEGLPVNLIQLLDRCIIIPQFGIIRSLNVHVTGAIVLWEYTRQIRCPELKQQ